MAAELTDEQIDLLALKYLGPADEPRDLFNAREMIREAIALATQGAEPVGEGFMTPDGKVVMTSHRVGYLRPTDEDYAAGCRIIPLYTASPPTAEVEKKAARYDWLREQSHPWGSGRWFSGAALDQAIDAALQSDQAQAGKGE